MAENDYANRKIRDMERQNQELKDRAQRGKGQLGKFRNDHQALSKRHQEFEQIINEMGRKSNINER